jgi:hypothetical protein
VQAWIERNAHVLTEVDGERLSQALSAEPKLQTMGEAHGKATWLVVSALRLHALRLLGRLAGRQHESSPSADDEDLPGRAKDRFQRGLQDAETVLREVRANVAIANAHRGLADPWASGRWLQDALTRLQSLASRNLTTLAEAIPPPELPRLGPARELMLRVFGIAPEEIARRRTQRLKKEAALRSRQLVEMAQLLAESFAAMGDKPAAQQALELMAKLG